MNYNHLRLIVILIVIPLVSLVGIFFVHFSWFMVALFVINYFFGMFFITAGYHRYFSHRSYKMARIPQFIMAWMAMSSAQKGILWWAATHRHHHKHSDDEYDIHSPSRRGFLRAHVGWLFELSSHTYDPKLVADFGKFPELCFLDKYFMLPTFTFAVITFFLGAFYGVHAGWGFSAGGISALCWGYGLVLLCLFQASWTVNSILHVYGTRRFETKDDSRNNWLVAIITHGEGWHNNHHYCQSSCRQGYKWWEIDITFYLLTLLSWIGIVKDMRPFKVKSSILEIEKAKSLS